MRSWAATVDLPATAVALLQWHHALCAITENRLCDDERAILRRGRVGSGAADRQSAVPGTQGTGCGEAGRLPEAPATPESGVSTPIPPTPSPLPRCNSRSACLTPPAEPPTNHLGFRTAPGGSPGLRRAPRSAAPALAPPPFAFPPRSHAVGSCSFPAMVAPSAPSLCGFPFRGGKRGAGAAPRMRERCGSAFGRLAAECLPPPGHAGLRRVVRRAVVCSPARRERER